MPEQQKAKFWVYDADTADVVRVCDTLEEAKGIAYETANESIEPDVVILKTVGRIVSTHTQQFVPDAD